MVPPRGWRGDAVCWINRATCREICLVHSQFEGARQEVETRKNSGKVEADQRRTTSAGRGRLRVLLCFSYFFCPFFFLRPFSLHFSLSIFCSVFTSLYPPLFLYFFLVAWTRLYMSLCRLVGRVTLIIPTKEPKLRREKENEKKLKSTEEGE